MGNTFEDIFGKFKLDIKSNVNFDDLQSNHNRH